jgi:hypothetical protein
MSGYFTCSGQLREAGEGYDPDLADFFNYADQYADGSDAVEGPPAMREADYYPDVFRSMDADDLAQLSIIDIEF